MSIKREISASVVDIHDFKRLALSSQASITLVNKMIEQGLPSDPDNSRESDHIERQTIVIPPPPPVISVLSSANTDFESQYEKGKEIGRGGFSTVFRCTHRITGCIYAVKIIDLRPLRLREKFSPVRLRREVDIMKRLRHPNIIQFVDVFETPDQLLVVMEYAPGMELFDVILSKKHMTEDDARPIFAQVARALYYLHSMSIIHRDIKPENILILNDPDSTTNLPVAKLLDFGLSKNAESSAAKTFVGTPCYLAPEVEFTSKGQGGQYGTPVDCWSVGAVLYVMLVARFPEFEIDILTRKPKLKMPVALWGNISEEAKSLILGLMNADPNTRLTMRDTLQHPWLQEFRANPIELDFQALNEMTQQSRNQLNNNNNNTNNNTNRIQHNNNTNNLHHHNLPSDITQVLPDHISNSSSYGFSNLMELDEGPPPTLNNMQTQTSDQHLNTNPTASTTTSSNYSSSTSNVPQDGGSVSEKSSASDTGRSAKERSYSNVYEFSGSVGTRDHREYGDSAMVLRQGGPGLNSNAVVQSVAEALPFAPLLQLQRSVATCFDEAHHCFLEMPEVAAQVRRGAVLSREQLFESVKMLRKVETTATSVITLLPDLEMAVEEGEPVLAAKFFNTLQTWVNDLKELVSSTQKITRDSMVAIQHVVDTSALSLNNQIRNNFATPFQLIEPGNESNQSIFEAMRSTVAPSTEPMNTDTDSAPRDENNNLNPLHRAANHLSQSEIMELFVNLFGRQFPLPPTQLAALSNNASLPSTGVTFTRLDTDSSQGGVSASSTSHTLHHHQQNNTQQSQGLNENDRHDSISSNLTQDSHQDSPSNLGERDRPLSPTESIPSTPMPMNNTNLDFTANAQIVMARSQAAARLSEALMKLRQVDLILVQLRRFWAETSGILDMLTREGQVAEDFIKFVHTPRLMKRFKERMNEYRMFWENVGTMCNNYLAGIREPSQRMYGFLDNVVSTPSSDWSTMSP